MVSHAFTIARCWLRHVTRKGRVATHVSLYAIARRDVKPLCGHVPM
jgi:hypothetical protein